MARLIASTALSALGLSGAPFHEPVQADGRVATLSVTERGDRNPLAQRKATYNVIEEVF
jgi:hypothetical protein